MEKYKVVTVGLDGNVSITPEKLEKMLNQAYNEGYDKGWHEHTYPVAPLFNTTPIDTRSPFCGTLTTDTTIPNPSTTVAICSTDKSMKG